MAKFILVVLFLSSFSAHADIFGFGSGEKSVLSSKLPELVEKLKSLEMKDDPIYEDAFNLGIKGVENRVEEEKLFCLGEATDAEGKTLPAAQKQLCMRELKKNYVESTRVIFELKKKYLALIHKRQLERLNDVQKKLQADIEKNF